jgi:Sulfotransferase family
MASEIAAVAGGEIKQRVPDFFIVGHPKCGTTALYEMLARHPQIFMPEVKEPRFFASDMRQRFQPSRAGALPATLEAYLDLFQGASPEQLAGEASPAYLASHTAAGLIAEVQPGARIVAILREPASFLHSLHQQLLRSHVESKKDLRTAMALERARSEGRRIPRRSHRPGALQYSDHVRYVEQLRRYEAAFPREQMLVLIYDDFRANNEDTVRAVLRFLGVDHTAEVDVHDANPAVRVRSQQLDELVHLVSVGRGPLAKAAKTVVNAAIPARARRGALQATRRHLVHGQPKKPDPELMSELRRRFKGEVVALSEHLDRDLVREWGYGDVH